MHVVIAGCGRVGSRLTVSLSQMGHTVSIIDKTRRAFERLPPGFEGQTFVGLAFDRATLEAAGIREAGAFVAVTNGDNSNIVSARVAREHYQTTKVVARIYDPRRAEIYRRLGIPTVATVRWASAQIHDVLFGSLDNTEATIGSDVVIVRLEIPAEFAGVRVGELNEAGKILVVAVDRLGRSQIPGAAATFQEGDIAHVAALPSALPGLRERLAEGAGS